MNIDPSPIIWGFLFGFFILLLHVFDFHKNDFLMKLRFKKITKIMTVL